MGGIPRNGIFIREENSEYRWQDNVSCKEDDKILGIKSQRYIQEFWLMEGYRYLIIVTINGEKMLLNE